MGKLVLILGGARSGKSSMAERRAREAGGRVTFVATAEARDGEMRGRIEAHRAARPAAWRTVEEPLALAEAVRRAAPDCDLLLVDCLTLWVSNHLCRLDEPVSEAGWHREGERLSAELGQAAADLVEVARSHPVTVLVVSNEVGLGLVPDNPLGRVYRDVLGAVNRRLAAEADEVLFMVAGLPLEVKRLAAGER